MAKKDDLGGIKLHSTPEPQTEEAEPKQKKPKKPPKGPEDVSPRGVGLKVIEWKRFDKIARELGMKPHALSLWAIRDFMRRYEAGEIETKMSKKLIG